MREKASLRRHRSRLCVCARLCVTAGGLVCAGGWGSVFKTGMPRLCENVARHRRGAALERRGTRGEGWGVRGAHIVA